MDNTWPHERATERARLREHQQFHNVPYQTHLKCTSESAGALGSKPLRRPGHFPTGKCLGIGLVAWLSSARIAPNGRPKLVRRGLNLCLNRRARLGLSSTKPND